MISYIVFGIAVIFYTLSQLCAHGKIKDNPDAKYASPKQPGKGIYYRITGVEYKERFFLSSTCLVFLVDKYHAFQFVFTKLLIFSIITFNSNFSATVFVIYLSIWYIAFNAIYNTVKIWSKGGKN